MTAPEIIARLIVTAEDMIERMESCIADGNGELEDDLPAIAGTITIYNLPTCDVCGDGFTPEEWNDRHDGHEPDCPVRLCEGYDGVCDCDLAYHAHCCPDCAGEEEGEG